MTIAQDIIEWKGLISTHLNPKLMNNPAKIKIILNMDKCLALDHLIIFLGGFWHLSQLKFEEKSPKIPRIQILRKLSPLLPPFTCPPGPPGDQKKFWEASDIYFSSSVKKYHQKT